MALFIASRVLNPIIYKMTRLKENAQGTKNAEIFKLTAPYNNPYISLQSAKETTLEI